MRFQCECLAKVVAAGLVVLASSSAAQTRVDIGYVYVDGRNNSGVSADTEVYSDWRSVDRGHGAAVSVRHDWLNAYVALVAQRGRLEHRHHRIRAICSGTWGDESSCEEHELKFRYSERMRTYAIRFGWRQQFGENTQGWVEAGTVNESWSSSGGTRQVVPVDDSLEVPLMPASANKLSWQVGAGLDFDIVGSARLSLGGSYKPHGYATAVEREGLTGGGSNSLLEGVIRYQQQFAGPWQGFVEYRPSEKRQYWHAGVGYRF